MNTSIKELRRLIAANVAVLCERARDRAMMETLDAIVRLQEHPEATDLDIQLTSELYAFLVDTEGPEVRSEIRNWDQAKRSADKLLE